MPLIAEKLSENPELYQRAQTKQNDNNYEIIKEDHNRHWLRKYKEIHIKLNM